MISTTKAEPQSLEATAQRRFQRSMSTPTKGEKSIPGKTMNKDMRAKRVTEPVLWYTHTPRPKLVKPEPARETVWPNQTGRNLRMGQRYRQASANPRLTDPPFLCCAARGVL